MRLVLEGSHDQIVAACTEIAATRKLPAKPDFSEIPVMRADRAKRKREKRAAYERLTARRKKLHDAYRAALATGDKDAKNTFAAGLAGRTEITNELVERAPAYAADHSQ